MWEDEKDWRREEESTVTVRKDMYEKNLGTLAPLGKDSGRGNTVISRVSVVSYTEENLILRSLHTSVGNW